MAQKGTIQGTPVFHSAKVASFNSNCSYPISSVDSPHSELQVHPFTSIAVFVSFLCSLLTTNLLALQEKILLFCGRCKWPQLNIFLAVVTTRVAAATTLNFILESKEWYFRLFFWNTFKPRHQKELSEEWGTVFDFSITSGSERLWDWNNKNVWRTIVPPCDRDVIFKIAMRI